MSYPKAPSLWLPPFQHRAMSTSGSIVLWFFFWWILLPVYAIAVSGWLAIIVAVNTVLVSWWMAVIACMSAVYLTAKAFQLGVRGYRQARIAWSERKSLTP